MKQHDVRITNETNAKIDNDMYTSMNITDKVEHLCDLFAQLHTNIRQDIQKSNNIETHIIYNRQLPTPHGG